MPEINLDDANSESRTLVMLQVVQKQHALVKANRFLLALVFVLMVAVVALGLVLLPRQHALNELQSRSSATADALHNPAISAEINALKGQLFGLVSGSIESKLRSLEENIKRGSLADSLNTIQDLKSDVKVLNAYTSLPQAKVENEPAANQQLIKELTELKDLVYLTFISCGLMFAAVAGVWLRNRYRLTHQKEPAIYLARKD